VTRTVEDVLCTDNGEKLNTANPSVPPKEGLVKNVRAIIGLGVLLIAAGVLFLLEALGVLPEIGNLVWIILFALGGLAFLWVYLANREQWWAAIPGCVLLGIAGTIALSDVAGSWAGALVPAAIGVSFWIIYLTRRDFWWAVIPGGVLLTVAVIAGFGDTLPDQMITAILFLGLALTFLLVYLLPTPAGRMKWAWIPAVVSAVLGIAFLASMGGMVTLLAVAGPLALIVGGGFLLWRGLKKPR
jgi:hypothetical protein